MSDLIKVPELIVMQGTSTTGQPARPWCKKVKIPVGKIRAIWQFPESNEMCVISLHGEITNRLIALPFKEMIALIASKLQKMSNTERTHSNFIADTQAIENEDHCLSMSVNTTPGCNLEKTADECRECPEYRNCNKRVHVICGKSLCPWSIRDNVKARCIGCERTMDCPDRDPSLVRAFPKLRSIYNIRK